MTGSPTGRPHLVTWRLMQSDGLRKRIGETAATSCGFCNNGRERRLVPCFAGNTEQHRQPHVLRAYQRLKPSEPSPFDVSKPIKARQSSATPSDVPFSPPTRPRCPPLRPSRQFSPGDFSGTREHDCLHLGTTRAYLCTTVFFGGDSGAAITSLFRRIYHRADFAHYHRISPGNCLSSPLPRAPHGVCSLCKYSNRSSTSRDGRAGLTLGPQTRSGHSFSPYSLVWDPDPLHLPASFNFGLLLRNAALDDAEDRSALEPLLDADNATRAERDPADHVAARCPASDTPLLNHPAMYYFGKSGS